MNRRNFLKTLCKGTAAAALANYNAASLFAADNKNQKNKPPNIVVIFADDLGYGDLGSFGHPTISTPNLDRMAAEGMKFSQFYSAAPVCTPSRAALLTGRLRIRNGMCSDRRRVLFPNSSGGLPKTEITIASALKTAGYATCCIGKWHLGHLPRFLPTNHGFDYYYGIPYSNDMKPCPLMRNEETIEEPADQTTLTRRYTEQALQFIQKNKNKLFFLYFPHTFPHIPLFASRNFKDKSLRGLYGDVIEELDWSVGKILDSLCQNHLDENTLVFFTSDNGPWLIMDLRGGSAGLLRGGKGSTWDGGMREPCIAWWPGKIKPNSTNPALASTMDIFTTCLELAAVPIPKDRIIDGVNILPALLGTGPSPRNVMFFYRGTKIMAVRKGPWKAHFITQAGYREKPKEHNPPLLFNLEYDPSEKFNVADKNPQVLADIQQVVEHHRKNLKQPQSQLELLIKDK